VPQAASPYHTTRLLLDGQQRLTSLSAVVRGKPVTVRVASGRSRSSSISTISKKLTVVTEVDEEVTTSKTRDGYR
jgi:hypothetical protein